jgi:radical SAM superfamily enzyme YgiQ (UPF0313 family)
MPFIGKRASLPPLGLLTVASMLPRAWKVRLVDMNVEKLSDSSIKWADMVFVSAMIVQKESVKNVIRRIKAFDGDKVVVAGGPYFSSCDLDSVIGVDHFVLGEAEVTLPLFLEDFKDGKGMAHKVYRSDEKPDLTCTPLPRWDLIKLHNYAAMAVQYTRGCPFNCEFCDITKLFGRATRSKSSQQIIGEMQHLYEAGWRGGVFIVDDNFVGNIVEVKSMLPWLIEWQKAHDHPFSFLTEASVNLAKDDNLLGLMRDAGFNQVFLGIETPSVESLKECHKGQNVHADLVEVVKTIQSFGMEVMGGFIVGFDSDRADIFKRQFEFVQKTGIVVAMVGVLNALPGTGLWERLKKSNRLTGYTTGNNLLAQTNFTPTMGAETLARGYKELLDRLYSPKGYYRRVETLLQNLKPSSRNDRIRWSDVSAFVRSLVRIGIGSKARFQYWRLIIRHSLSRRKFPLAVRFAIIGEHFRMVSEKIVAV